VHEAGATTVDLLAYLAPRLAALPILLLVTYRDDDAPREHPLRDLRRRLQREGLAEHLALSRLPPAAARQALVHVLGDAGQAAAERLLALSEGHPLFLDMLVRNQQEAGPGPTSEPQNGPRPEGTPPLWFFPTGEGPGVGASRSPSQNPTLVRRPGAACAQQRWVGANHGPSPKPTLVRVAR
jgi:hypothetical protein